jgi:hypothetical protein
LADVIARVEIPANLNASLSANLSGDKDGIFWRPYDKEEMIILDFSV